MTAIEVGQLVDQRGVLHFPRVLRVYEKVVSDWNLHSFSFGLPASFKLHRCR